MKEKSPQQRKGDAAAVSRRHRVAASLRETEGADPSATPAGVSKPGVPAASTPTSAAVYRPASVSTVLSGPSPSPAECSSTAGSPSGSGAPSGTRSAKVIAPESVAEKQATYGSTTVRNTVAFETSAAPGKGSSSAVKDKAPSAAARPPGAEASAVFLATPVTTTGVAREVSGANEEDARLANTAMPSGPARPPTKTIAELEGVSGRQPEPLSDNIDWEGEKYLHTDPFEPHGSPAASLLIFALYSVFFVVAGFSLAEGSLQLPVPIRRIIDQRCAGTSQGGICIFAQGMRCVTAAGVAVGCVLGGSFADCYGRKTLLCLSDVFLFLGLSLPLATADFSVFCASRAFFGVGLGGGLIAVSIFLVECVPASARGLSFGVGKLFTLIGHVSAVSMVSTAPHCGLLCGVGMPALVVTLHSIVLLSFAPESPRWLVGQKRPAKAIEALLCFGDHEKTYETLLGAQRSRFLLVLTCACVATCVGAGFFDIYPTLSITEKEWFGASSGVTQTLGVVVSIVLVDCWGRGPLLRVGTIGVALGFSAASTGCFWHVYVSASTSHAAAPPAGKAADAGFDSPAQSIVLIGILFVRLMQNISWSTLLPVVVAEVLPTSVRATGAGLALGLLTILELAINMTIPSLSSEHTAAVTLIAYAISSYIAVALVTLGLPEGKGYRLEELAPESVDGNVPWVSNASCGRQMQQLQESETLPGQEGSSAQSSYSQTAFAPTTTPTVEADGLSSEMQTASQQKLEREALGVC